MLLFVVNQMGECNDEVRKMLEDEVDNLLDKH